MKRVLSMLTAAMLLAVAPLSAQNKKTGTKESFGKKVSKFWKKTKKEMEDAGHELGDAIGFEDRIAREDDLVKVDGTYYMPIYKVNQYKGADADEYCEASRKKFGARYPNADIQSVVIPQGDWISKTVKQNDKIKGYQQTLYCYVLARDGNDGYIYAKFVYARYKDVGGTYNPVSGMWGTWERTDVIPNATYTKLLNK